MIMQTQYPTQFKTMKSNKNTKGSQVNESEKNQRVAAKDFKLNINKTIPLKPKVNVLPIIPVESLISLNEYLTKISLDEGFNLLMQKYNISVENTSTPAEGTHSILELIQIPSLVGVLLPKDEKGGYLIPDGNNIKGDTVSAIMSRIFRTKFKLFVFYQMLDLTPNTSMLKKKYITLLKKMAFMRFDLDFTKSKIAGVNATSTLNLIKKFLVQVEFELKTFLEPLHDLRHLVSLTIGHPTKDIKHFSQLANALKTIAPRGFQGIEQDYYYVCRLLLDPQIEHEIFNEIQKKQWLTYKQELYSLLTFCTIDHPNGVEGLSNIMEAFGSSLGSSKGNGTTINVPISKFITEKCSNNTFSRFIHVLNYFLPVVWLVSYNVLYDIAFNNSMTKSL